MACVGIAAGGWVEPPAAGQEKLQSETNASSSRSRARTSASFVERGLVTCVRATSPSSTQIVDASNVAKRAAKPSRSWKPDDLRSAVGRPLDERFERATVVSPHRVRVPLLWAQNAAALAGAGRRSPRGMARPITTSGASVTARAHRPALILIMPSPTHRAMSCPSLVAAAPNQR